MAKKPKPAPEPVLVPVPLDDVESLVTTIPLGDTNPFAKVQDDLDALRAAGIEQFWSPPCITRNGKLVCSLPRGPHRELKAYEIYDLVHLSEKWGRALDEDETRRALGWPAP